VAQREEKVFMALGGKKELYFKGDNARRKERGRVINPQGREGGGGGEKKSILEHGEREKKGGP